MTTHSSLLDLASPWVFRDRYWSALMCCLWLMLGQRDSLRHSVGGIVVVVTVRKFKHISPSTRFSVLIPRGNFDHDMHSQLGTVTVSSPVLRSIGTRSDHPRDEGWRKSASTRKHFLRFSIIFHTAPFFTVTAKQGYQDELTNGAEQLKHKG